MSRTSLRHGSASGTRPSLGRADGVLTLSPAAGSTPSYTPPARATDDEDEDDEYADRWADDDADDDWAASPR